MPAPPDATEFIRANLPLKPDKFLSEISLHTPTVMSGLSQFLAAHGDKAQQNTPYWAYVWPGGLAVARYMRGNPALVVGKSVLDLGAGSGLVGIAAAMAGANVTANEIDPHGRAAIALNMAANNVTLEITGDDLLNRPPPNIDVITAGDMFYEPQLAQRTEQFLRAAADQGATVLIGSPVRTPLPLERLEKIAEYVVPDFADTGYHFDVKTGVYRFASD